MTRILYYFISLVILSSCSTLEHNKIRLTKTASHAREKNIQIKKLPTQTTELKSDTADELIKEEALASVVSSLEFSSSIISKKKNWNQDDKCDIILFRNGEEVEAKIIEVGIDEIKYKKCNNLEGPIYTSLKKDVFMVKYSNGDKDVYEEEKPLASEAKTGGDISKPARPHAGGVVGLVLSIVGLAVGYFILWPLGFLGVPAIVLGSVAVAAKKKHPEKYKGIATGVLAIIFGILALAGTVLFILLVL